MNLTSDSRDNRERIPAPDDVERRRIKSAIDALGIARSRQRKTKARKTDSAPTRAWWIERE
jgi:hypothetical protein